jgi:hypothetical protein
MITFWRARLGILGLLAFQVAHVVWGNENDAKSARCGLADHALKCFDERVPAATGDLKDERLKAEAPKNKL